MCLANCAGAQADALNGINNAKGATDGETITNMPGAAATM
jgi:hypothetical protein